MRIEFQSHPFCPLGGAAGKPAVAALCMAIMQRLASLCRLRDRSRRFTAAWACLLSATLLGGEALGAAYSRGVLIRFDGEITPMLEQYLYRKLEEAQRRDADLVIPDKRGYYVHYQINEKTLGAWKELADELLGTETK